MVLKTKAIICLFLLSAAEHLFSKEMDRSNYAFLVIAKILKESPEAVILNNNADSLDMAFKQQEKWTDITRCRLRTLLSDKPKGIPSATIFANRSVTASFLRNLFYDEGSVY